MFLFVVPIDKRRWTVTFGDKGKTAPLNAMNQEFSRVLRSQMEQFADTKQVDKLSKVQKDVEDVKGVMVSNIGTRK